MRNLFLTLIAAMVAIPSLAQTTADSRYKRIELSFVSRHDYWIYQYPDMSSNGIAGAFIMGQPLNAVPQMAIEYGGEVAWSHRFKRESGTRVYRQDFLWLSLPVVARYNFRLSDKLTLSPLAGMNFKFNLVGNRRDKHEFYNYYATVKTIEKERINYLDREREYPARIFQFGARAGVGLTFDKWYLGYTLQYDFTPYIKEEPWDDIYNKLRTLVQTVSVGFQF